MIFISLCGKETGYIMFWRFDSSRFYTDRSIVLTDKDNRIISIFLKYLHIISIENTIIRVEEILMKATGIVRRIDDLGRIVIPKEIRRTLRMKEGDPLEIFIEATGEIVLKKYSMMEGISAVGQRFAESLNKVSGLSCVICDGERVVAFAGQNKKDYIDKPITKEIEEICFSRMSYFKQFQGEKAIYTNGGASMFAIGITPIINGGDCAGAIALLGEGESILSETQKKLMILTSNLLADNL